MTDSWSPGKLEVLPSPFLIWHWVTGLTLDPCRTCVPIVSLHTGPLYAGHSVPLSAPDRTGCWELLSPLVPSVKFITPSDTSLSPVTERSPHFRQHLYGRPMASKRLCILTDLLCQSSLWSHSTAWNCAEIKGLKMTEPASMVRMAFGHQSSALSHDKTFCGHPGLSKSSKDTVLGGRYL